jgi:hypothetical protein
MGAAHVCFVSVFSTNRFGRCPKKKDATVFAQPKSLVKRLIPPDLTVLSALRKEEAECQRRQYFQTARPHEGVLAALKFSSVRLCVGPSRRRSFGRDLIFLVLFASRQKGQTKASVPEEQHQSKTHF